MVLAKALKVEIEITVDALKAYDAGDYDTALQKFEVSLLSSLLTLANCRFFKSIL
jgi:hypothetical protein